jgi:hypothetical protein
MDLALDTSTPRLTLTAGEGAFAATFIAPEGRRGNRHLVEGWKAVIVPCVARPPISGTSS